MLTVALVVAACGTGSEEASSEGVGSGIGVHGAWTLDVYNEDGSLDRTAQFDNALSVSGASALAEFLAGQTTPGNWRLILGKASGEPDPCTLNNQPSPCSTNATVEIPTAGVLTLSGEMTIEASTTVGRVDSLVSGCSSATTPDDCVPSLSTGSFQFTVKNADSDTTDEFEPVPVTAGQTVHVTVELTFGTLP